MSKTRFEIQASAAQVATGNGGGIPVAGIKAMAVYADVTNASGTLTIFLQSSVDGGTTWFDLMHDGSLALAATAAEGTHTHPAISSGSGTNTGGGRNIASSITATGKFYAKYAAAIGDMVRAAWVISGGSPTFTFSVKAIGENN